jgi:hypothetical protein
MRRTPRLGQTAAILLALTATATPIGAVSYISIQAGEFLLLNPGVEGAPSPLLTTLGAAIPLVEAGPFRLEVSTLLWGTTYYYLPDAGRAVPALYEADQFSVLGVWLAPLAGFHVQIAGGQVELGAAATMALNFRFPLLAVDEGEQYLPAARTYFFGQARFLFPETDIWIRWRAFENLSFALTLKALYPLFHAWDGDGQGIPDQLFLAAVFGFDIRLAGRRGAAPGGPS